MYFCLSNIINSTYTESLREVVPPPRQNTVAVFNQITFLILYYISSRLVTLLKVFDILGLTVSFEVLKFSSQVFLFFFNLRLPTLLWSGSCVHWIYSLLPLI
jgi:hypothetical protein